MSSHPHFTPSKPTPSLSSAGVDSNTVKLKSEDVKSVLISDIDCIFDRITVIPAKELIEETFGTGAWLENVPANVKEAFKEVNPSDWKDRPPKRKKPKERRLYNPLTKAFNLCCPELKKRTEVDHHHPTQKLCCLNVHANTWPVGEESGIESKMGPDLFLTFDYTTPTKPDNASSSKQDEGPMIAAGSSLFRLPGIIIEVKGDHNADLRVQPPSAETSFPPPSGKTRTKRPKHVANKPPTKAQRQLVSQSFGYIAVGHWPTTQNRFLYCFTVAGHVLRIWRYSSSGVIATEAIDYTKDPTAIYSFLQAIGLRDYSALGVDVGPDQTFQLVDDEDINKKKQELIDAYAKSSPSLEHWAAAAANQPLWLFKFPNERWTNPRYKKVQSLVVASKPIFASMGVFNRATHCYIATSEEAIKKKEPLTISDIMTIKLASQFVCCIHDAYHYKHAITNDRGDGAHGHIPHVATVVAGGGLDNSLQHNGSFLRFTKDSAEDDGYTFVSPLPRISKIGADSYLSGKSLEKWSNDVPDDWRVDVREIRWTVFSDVGGQLHDFKNAKELLNVSIGIIKAHEDLFTRGILHRDISSNNIMIHLNGSGGERRGLLIDLDMAANLQEERKHTENEITLFEEALILAEERFSRTKVDASTDAEQHEPLSLVRPHSAANESGRSLRSTSNRSIVESSDEEQERKATKKKNREDEKDYSQSVHGDESTDTPFSESLGALMAVVNLEKEEAEKGRPPITGTLMFMAAGLRYAPVHGAWHDLESIFHVFVLLVCRHFKQVSYLTSDGITRLVTTVEERQELLKTIFPRGTLEVRSEAKRKFLKDGEIKTPEYEGLTNMIRRIQLGFNRLYNAIDTGYSTCKEFEKVYDFIASKNELSDIARDKLPRWTTPPKSSFYSISDYESLELLLNSMNDVENALDEIFKDLPGAAKMEIESRSETFSAELSLFEVSMKTAKRIGFPTHQWMRGLFRDAHQQTQDDNVGPYHFEPTRRNRQSISKSTQPLATPRDGFDGPLESQSTPASSKSSRVDGVTISASGTKRKRLESTLEDKDEGPNTRPKRRASQRATANK